MTQLADVANLDDLNELVHPALTRKQGLAQNHFGHNAPHRPVLNDLLLVAAIWLMKEATKIICFINLVRPCRLAVREVIHFQKSSSGRISVKKRTICRCCKCSPMPRRSARVRDSSASRCTFVANNELLKSLEECSARLGLMQGRDKSAEQYKLYQD